MSTTAPAVPAAAAASNGNGLSANGYGQPILTPSTPTAPSYHPQFASAPIYDPAQHQVAFHKASGDLAQVFSQVPWMKFSIVAKPDYSELAQNATLQNFVAQVTAMTIARVSQQIHAEITERVDRIIKTITSDVNGRMKGMHVKIMQGVVTHAIQHTSTEYHKLDFDPYNVLFKEMVSDSKEECHCSPHLYDCPAPPQPPVVKPTIPPVVLKPSKVDALSVKKASWIWTPEVVKNPQPRVGHTRVFRRVITTLSPVDALLLEASADDMYSVYVNGKLVGSGSDWTQPDRYMVRFEATNKVTIALVASQGRPEVIVGAIAAGRLWNTQVHPAVPVDFTTDRDWLCFSADGVREQFVDTDYVASSWDRAHVIAAVGTASDAWRDMKDAAPGKAAGRRIAGVPNVPDAPQGTGLAEHFTW